MDLSVAEGRAQICHPAAGIHQTFSKGTIKAEEQSLYRTLRKFYHLKMVDFSSGKGHKGPDRNTIT